MKKLMIDNNEFYTGRYDKQTKDPNNWFSSAIMNQQIGEFLLRKYNSSHKRLLALHTGVTQSPAKKFRINPYHLTLHKYILMFFGLSLECWLKGLLIKIEKVNPVQITDGKYSLSRVILTHKIEAMYLQAFEKIDPKQRGTLERLERAVLAGKYPFEKNIRKIDPYTAYLVEDLKIARQIIKKIKKTCEL